MHSVQVRIDAAAAGGSRAKGGRLRLLHTQPGKDLLAKGVLNDRNLGHSRERTSCAGSGEPYDNGVAVNVGAEVRAIRVPGVSKNQQECVDNPL